MSWGGIPRHLLDELRHMEVSASRRFAAGRPGSYSSPQRDRGLEFDRHRAYEPGDDIRRIDWNVTARLNAPYLRETHAERELDVMVVVDVSRSMELGTARHSKRELQILVAGSLMFSAAGDGINVGMLAFGARVVSYDRPRRGRGRALRLLEQLWASPVDPGATAFRPAVAHLLEHLRAGTLVFLVSDFQARDVAGPEFRVLAAHHYVRAVVVEDPLESELPAHGGVVELLDLESGRSTRVALTSGLRERVASVARERRKDLTRRLHTVPITHAFVRSKERVLEPVMRLLATPRHA